MIRLHVPTSRIAILSLCALLGAVWLSGCRPMVGSENARLPSSDTTTANSPPATSAMNADDQSSVTAAQVRQEAKEAVQTATAFATQQRKEYRAQMRQRLETIQAHVDALKAQLAQAPPDAAAEARRFFEQMEQQLATARAKADQPEATTEEAWESLRSELDAAIQGLEQSAEDVRARLTDQQEKDQELTDQQEDNQEQPASEK